MDAIKNIDLPIPLFKVFMDSKASEDVGKTLTSGFISQGPKVEEFEALLQKHFKNENILTVNSATSGLVLAIRLCNLEKDDEVLCCPLTCFATTVPVLLNNVQIKWVDVDKDTCNISLTDLKAKISERTKVILLVHWGGTPVDLSEIERIQAFCYDTYGFKPMVIEDCAHSFGTTYDSVYLGSRGKNICVYSFQAIKHFTTGDGGMICLPNNELYSRAKLLRWFGIDKNKRSGNGDFRLESNIEEWGYKFNMNDINATIGITNLPHALDIVQKHKDNAKYYTDELSKLKSSNIRLFKYSNESSYWLFTIKIADRDRFIKYMGDREITVSAVHRRNDVHSCVEKYKTYLPVLDELEKEMVCLPVGWWVTETQREYIVESIKNFLCIPRKIKGTDFSGISDLLFQLNGVRINEDYEPFHKKLAVIEAQGSEIYVIEINGVVIATGKLVIEYKLFSPVGHIEDVVVDQKYRNRGLGKIIINTLVERAKEKGCYKTVLSCADKNIDFYRKCGLEVRGVEMGIKY